MIVPASVTAIGAVILIPLSPALIFGWGPLPQLGIAGGAAAIILFYAVGSAYFAVFLWSGRGVLRRSHFEILAYPPCRPISGPPPCDEAARAEEQYLCMK